jgi:hypothetical protein
MRAIRRPGKRREVPVVALADHIQIEAEAVHLELRRSCQREAAAGGMRRVVDIERLAAAVA